MPEFDDFATDVMAYLPEIALVTRPDQLRDEAGWACQDGYECWQAISTGDTWPQLRVDEQRHAQDMSALHEGAVWMERALHLHHMREGGAFAHLPPEVQEALLGYAARVQAMARPRIVRALRVYRERTNPKPSCELGH